MRRIRSIKPEWLEDERLALASSDARVLTIGLILLADDYGRGRANRVMLASTIFPGKVIETLTNALQELVDARFVVVYRVDEQDYFEIRNWSKHQKVDKPGKEKFPAIPPLFEVGANPLETVEKNPETLANPRASRASSPFPSLPDPGLDPAPKDPPDAQRSRERFWNLEDALKVPLLDRCDIALRFAIDTHWLEAVQPERWPELTQVASALALADGREQVPRLGRYARDAGTRAIVATLATHPLESVLAALPRVVADPWWQRERPSLSALLPDRITAAQSPPPKQGTKRPGATPTQPNYGVKIDAEEYQ